MTHVTRRMVLEWLLGVAAGPAVSSVLCASDALVHLEVGGVTFDNQAPLAAIRASIVG
jgi:hypothetical protein